MIFNGSSILFCVLLHAANSEDVNVIQAVVKSGLAYYRSRSVVLIVDAGDSSTSDLFAFLTLQKRLSSGEEFFFSSLTTLSSFPKSIRTTRHGPSEAVVVWNPNKNFPLYLEKISNGIDIPHKWLLKTTLTPTAFDNVTIPIHREFTIVCRTSESGYVLEEIYDVRPGRRLKRSVGQWSGRAEEFQLPAPTDLFRRRGDFQGAPMRVVSPKRDSCDGASFAVVIASVVSCIHQQLWGLMEEILNATTEIQVVPKLNADTIRRVDADLSLRSAHLNVIEMNTRDYVWPTFAVKVEVVTSYIKQKVEWETYILPFTDSMWIVILIWILLLDFTLASVQFFTSKKGNKNSFLTYCRESSFTTAFIFCSQGVLCPSKLFSTRIIFLMMFIVPGVLFPGYSAVLTSFLTIQQDKQPFQNLEELSRNKEYKLGWHNTFAIEHMFNLKNMTPLNEALLRNNILPQEELPATDEEGIRRMCNEKFSYLTIKDTLLALKPECRYYKFKQHFRTVFAGMEMKKNTWYKYFLDRCERTLTFSGIKHRMELDVVMEYVQYDANTIVDKNEFPAIKVENIVLPLAVLLLGVIASVVLLLIEVIFFRLKSRASITGHSVNRNRI